MGFKATADNKRVSGLGFQPSPKSHSATSDTCKSMKRILSRKNFKDHHTVAPLLIQAL